MIHSVWHHLCKLRSTQSIAGCDIWVIHVVKYEHVYEKKLIGSQDSCYFLEGGKAVQRNLPNFLPNKRFFLFVFYWSDFGCGKMFSFAISGSSYKDFVVLPLIFCCMFEIFTSWQRNSHGILHPLTWAVMSMVRDFPFLSCIWKNFPRLPFLVSLTKCS